MGSSSGIGSFSQAEVVIQAKAIIWENAKPGTTDWQLTYVKFDGKEKFQTRLNEGYRSRASVRPGRRISFHLTDLPP
jgi:hypothetical protein